MTYIELDGCAELRDTLKSIVHKQDFAIKAQKAIIDNSQSELAISKDIIKKQDVVIYDFKKLDAKEQKQIWFLKTERNILAITLAVAAVKIFILH